MVTQSTYESDYVAWIDEQAKLMRDKRFEEVDLENVLEEFESMARRDKRALKSMVRLLLMHMLKQKYQPSRNCRSWEDTIKEARRRIHEIIEDSPSLNNFLQDYLNSGSPYEAAREDAALETDIYIEKFLKKCPWTLEQILDEKFYI